MLNHVISRAVSICSIAEARIGYVELFSSTRTYFLIIYKLDEYIKSLITAVPSLLDHLKKRMYLM